jgi:hypothetical protein
MKAVLIFKSVRGATRGEKGDDCAADHSGKYQ